MSDALYIHFILKGHLDFQQFLRVLLLTANCKLEHSKQALIKFFFVSLLGREG